MSFFCACLCVCFFACGFLVCVFCQVRIRPSCRFIHPAGPSVHPRKLAMLEVLASYWKMAMHSGTVSHRHESWPTLSESLWVYAFQACGRWLITTRRRRGKSRRHVWALRFTHGGINANLPFGDDNEHPQESISKLAKDDHKTIGQR